MVVLAYGLGLIAAGLARDRSARRAQGALRRLLSQDRGRERVRPKHAWDIATSLLQSIATSVVIYGVLFVVAAFLASPAGYAVGIRRALAPTLRDRPGSSGRSSAAARPDRVDHLAARAGSRQLVLTLLLIALAGVWLEALTAKDRSRVPRRQARATG